MVSNIGDGWKETYPNKWPQFPQVPPSSPFSQPLLVPPGVSQADFDALKREVEELKKLLTAAAEFDKKTGQPHCEIDEKVRLIKAIANMVGVDMGDVFDGEHKSP